MTNTEHPTCSQVSPSMARPSIPCVGQRALESARISLPPLPDPPDGIAIGEWDGSLWAYSGEQLHDYGDKCFRDGMAFALGAFAPDRTPASSAAGQTASRYTVGPNPCDCHPETCCCLDWAVFAPDGKKHSTQFTRRTADEIAAALNRPTAKGAAGQEGGAV